MDNLDEQQFVILFSLFQHWDHEMMQRVVYQRGERLREVAHAFQDAVNSPLGQALMAFPTWEPTIALRLTQNLRLEVAATVSLLLTLKYIDNHDHKN